MLYTKAQIQHIQASLAAAFPRFTAWESAHEGDEAIGEFSIWGEYTLDMIAPSSPNFFVTFIADRATWRGYLTVGKHSYYWSSADIGDAYLLDTESCATLDEAVAALKESIGSLFAALSGSDASP